ncbi:MAG: hypothetical protein QN819_07805 [Nitrososphaeraceae archaeon]|nr:hypothetical protein [Nitrososphaeraceae archaeon]
MLQRHDRKKQTRIEKISLVSFKREAEKMLITMCRCLKRNKIDFYQNSNLHVILIAFGPPEKNNMKY